MKSGGRLVQKIQVKLWRQQQKPWEWEQSVQESQKRKTEGRDREPWDANGVESFHWLSNIMGRAKAELIFSQKKPAQAQRTKYKRKSHPPSLSSCHLSSNWGKEMGVDEFQYLPLSSLRCGGSIPVLDITFSPGTGRAIIKKGGGLINHRGPVGSWFGAK